MCPSLSTHYTNWLNDETFRISYFNSKQNTYIYIFCVDFNDDLNQFSTETNTHSIHTHGKFDLFALDFGMTERKFVFWIDEFIITYYSYNYV